MSTISQRRPLRLLYLVLETSEQDFAYNELCHGMAATHQISLCSYFPPPTTLRRDITVYSGDGTLTGFIKSLRTAAVAGNPHYDIVHAHTPHVAFLLMIASLGLPLNASAKVMSVYHSYTNKNLKARTRLLELPVFLRFDRIVFCSESSRESFPPFYRVLAAGRDRVVFNGVNLEDIDRTVDADTHQERDPLFRITSVGRLIPIKNPSVLLDAFVGIENCQSELIFAGGGPLEQRLKNCIPKGMEDQIRLIGTMSREMIFRLLARTDLFISMSTGEGLPVAVLEALAARCPVILSDIPAHREIAAGAPFIPLLPSGDADSLRREILRIMALPGAKRRRLGDQGRRLVEKRFSLTNTVDGYEAVYQELTGLKRDGEDSFSVGLEGRH